MDNVDLLITGGEVITHTERSHATVAIRQGKVAALLESPCRSPESAKSNRRERPLCSAGGDRSAYAHRRRHESRR